METIVLWRQGLFAYNNLAEFAEIANDFFRNELYNHAGVTPFFTFSSGRNLTSPSTFEFLVQIRQHDEKAIEAFKKRVEQFKFFMEGYLKAEAKSAAG